MLWPIKTQKKYEKPKRVFWWFELICNLKCNHCDIGHKTLIEKFRPNLSIEKKKQVIDKLHKWLGNEFSLSFIAGEPFLHKDMLDVLSYAKEKNITTSLTSNGTLISLPKKAEAVVKSGLNFIAISLDSYEAKIHDETRGKKGARDQAMAAIKNMQEAKKKLNSSTPTIYVNSIIMRDNLKEIIKLVKWVKKEKIDGITFQPIANPDMFEGDGNGLSEYWFKESPLWPDKKEVLDLLTKLKEMKKNGYPIQNSAKDFKKFKKYFTNPVTFALKSSNEGELESLSITHDAFVKMCPAENENFGNILKQDLDKMWHSKVADKARDHVLSCKSQCKILANNKENFYF